MLLLQLGYSFVYDNEGPNQTTTIGADIKGLAFGIDVNRDEFVDSSTASKELNILN